MAAPAIDITNLSLRQGDRPLFTGLDLQLAHQKKATLVGQSGSGKSSLLQCLLGFLPPHAGSVRLFGLELTPLSAWQLRRRLAYVPQEPALGSGEVGPILKQPFRFRCNRRLQSNLGRVPGLLEQMLLPQEILAKDLTSLSGGEKQRIALLLALLLDREILLLDEASSALDQAAKDAVIDLLRGRVELTILAVSHDRQWQRLGDRIIDLQQAQRRPE